MGEASLREQVDSEGARQSGRGVETLPEASAATAPRGGAWHRRGFRMEEGASFRRVSEYHVYELLILRFKYPKVQFSFAGTMP